MKELLEIAFFVMTTLMLDSFFLRLNYNPWKQYGIVLLTTWILYSIVAAIYFHPLTEYSHHNISVNLIGYLGSTLFFTSIIISIKTFTKK